ncbi:MAG TPA: hypothetical protein VFQ51_20865 [Vicinamibacteria bacterium]|nr:hypothetical protein [Vicinamibacteria bacterium]
MSREGAMWKRATFVACVLMGAAAAHAQPADGGAEDDLAVVKRAVEKEDAAPTPPARRTEHARWFRVRIEERGGGRVKINLPLMLVRELDDHVPFDLDCGRKHHQCRIRLSEVLDQLDSGQDLVEIKDADSTVRIWVD